MAMAVRQDGVLCSCALSPRARLSIVSLLTGYYWAAVPVSGTYTLTPALSGHFFTPPTRTVSVPPYAVGQDFTANLGVGTRGRLSSACR
jgi:hypothetical protein